MELTRSVSKLNIEPDVQCKVSNAGNKPTRQDIVL
jgi:hypothetical protein